VPQVQLPHTAAAVPLPLPLHAAKALLRQNPFAPQDVEFFSYQSRFGWYIHFHLHHRIGCRERRSLIIDAGLINDLSCPNISLLGNSFISSF
jgi:hypothetical protein